MSKKSEPPLQSARFATVVCGVQANPQRQRFSRGVHTLLVLLFMCLGNGPLRAAASGESLTGSVSVEDFKVFVEKKSGIVLDARNDMMYRKGHVPGALSLSSERFRTAYAKQKSVLEANKTRPIIVYCLGPGCGTSEDVHQKLIRLGYTNVAVFSGGWAGWQEAKLPEEKSEGADVPLKPWKKRN